MTNQEIIQRHVKKWTQKVLSLSETKSDRAYWVGQHRCGWANNDNGIPALIAAIADYMDRFDKGVGEGYDGIAHDGYIGPCIESMLSSVVSLLSGSIKRLDGGLTDALIRAIAENGGFDTDQI